jgi:hypothetical protein
MLVTFEVFSQFVSVATPPLLRLQALNIFTIVVTAGIPISIS